MDCSGENYEKEEEDVKQIITISIPDGRTFDIQMDNEQRIKTTLKVLSENIMGLEWLGEDVVIREKRSGRRVDIEQTYKDAKIYTGFEIVVIPKKTVKESEEYGKV